MTAPNFCLHSLVLQMKGFEGLGRHNIPEQYESYDLFNRWAVPLWEWIGVVEMLFIVIILKVLPLKQ